MNVVWIILYYDRTDVFGGIDITKTSEPKECDVCHYWYFFTDYYCIISCAIIGESETVNLLQNVDLSEQH